MKRYSPTVLLVSALALAASTLTGCTGNRGGKKADQAAAAAEQPAAGGSTIVTMDQVDESLNAKITGERFRVTYTDKDPMKGAATPLVTIIEFSDFQCPFCQRFSQQTLPAIRESLGDDVALAFLHFPIVQIHPNAGNASAAAVCAGEQGKFWEMHDLLFAKQKEWESLP